MMVAMMVAMTASQQSPNPRNFIEPKFQSQLSQWVDIQSLRVRAGCEQPFFFLFSLATNLQTYHRAGSVSLVACASCRTMSALLAVSSLQSQASPFDQTDFLLSNGML